MIPVPPVDPKTRTIELVIEITSKVPRLRQTIKAKELIGMEGRFRPVTALEDDCRKKTIAASEGDERRGKRWP